MTTKLKDLEAEAAEIQKKIDAAREDEGKVAFVKDLRRQLGEHLAEGTDHCKNCGHEVVGMLKTPAYFDSRQGIEVPAVWEIGCVICPPIYVKSDRDFAAAGKLDGKKGKFVRRSYSARGTSIERARENWNNGVYVEDTKFGLNVRPDEHKRLELDPVEKAEK